MIMFGGNVQNADMNDELLLFKEVEKEKAVAQNVQKRREEKPLLKGK